jgi:hypothetical protein
VVRDLVRLKPDTRLIRLLDVAGRWPAHQRLAGVEGVLDLAIEIELVGPVRLRLRASAGTGPFLLSAVFESRAVRYFARRFRD